MTESISNKIVELVATGHPVQGQETGEPIVTLYLSEAEVGDYPYAVLDHDVNFYHDKDGIYKIASNSVIHVYSNNVDDADRIAAEIAAVIEAGMQDTTYRAIKRNLNKDCTDNVWDISLTYRINQYK